LFGATGTIRSKGPITPVELHATALSIFHFVYYTLSKSELRLTWFLGAGFCGANTLHKTISTTFFLYFACILPAIAFGVLNYNNTGGQIGLSHSLIYIILLTFYASVQSQSKLVYTAPGFCSGRSLDTLVIRHVWAVLML